MIFASFFRSHFEVVKEYNYFNSLDHTRGPLLFDRFQCCLESEWYEKSQSPKYAYKNHYCSKYG